MAVRGRLHAGSLTSASPSLSARQPCPECWGVHHRGTTGSCSHLARSCATMWLMAQDNWERSGAYPWSIYAAPWSEPIGSNSEGDPIMGPSYLPRSSVRGTAVSYSEAMLTYLDDHNAVGSPGLWDFEIDPGLAPAGRYDQEQVIDIASRRPWLFGSQQHAVIEYFWRRMHSERVTAVLLGLSADRVHRIIGEVRHKTTIVATKGSHPPI